MDATPRRSSRPEAAAGALRGTRPSSRPSASSNGLAGLPVVSAGRHAVIGWITNQDVVAAMADRVAAADAEIAQGSLAAEFVDPPTIPRRCRRRSTGTTLSRSTSPGTAAASTTWSFPPVRYPPP